MTENELTIPGYTPTWHDKTQALIAGVRLMALRGSEAQEAWTLWTGAGWGDRAPVILMMGGSQLEICARRVTDLSVTPDPCHRLE